MGVLFRSRFVTENRQVACSSHARHFCRNRLDFCRNCPSRRKWESFTSEAGEVRRNWESLKSADRGAGRNQNWVSHPATPKMKTDRGACRNQNWVSHPATPKMKSDRGTGRNANWVSHSATPKNAFRPNLIPQQQHSGERHLCSIHDVYVVNMKRQ